MYRPVQEARTWGRMEGRCRPEETRSRRKGSDRARVQKLERALQREFSVICFAWDGTAVARRDADASAVRSRVERLTALGVDIAVISSADVADVDAQLRARPGVEGRLFLYLSRGSEIYVVGPAGPRLLERRESTSLEEEQVVATAEALRDRLAAAGLDVALVGDHLNRRSVDLVPDWPEPPGADVAELRRQVEERLRGAGFAGGLTECMELAREIGREAGLSHPAVTSDVRHIDIGLTGKGDAMHAVTRALVTRARPAAAGPAGAGRHVRARRRRARAPTRRCSSPSCAAPCTSASARSRPACRRRCCTPAAARRRFLDILHDQLAMREIVAQRELSRAERRPRLAVRGQGLRPVPRARGRDVAHGRQRRDRHARGARGGLRDLDAGHLRRRRLRRRDRRPALPAAGPGAGLDRPPAHGGRQRHDALQRRDHRPRARARHAPRHRLPLRGGSGCAAGARSACARRGSPRWPTAR